MKLFAKCQVAKSNFRGRRTGRARFYRVLRVVGGIEKNLKKFLSTHFGQKLGCSGQPLYS